MAFPIRNVNFWLISFSLYCFFDDVPKFIAISFVIKKLLVNCGSIFLRIGPKTEPCGKTILTLWKSKSHGVRRIAFCYEDMI